MFTILQTNDMHCGHVLGLTPPQYQSDDNRDWLGPLWEFYNATLYQIGKVDAHVFLGDAIEGHQEKDPAALLKPDINVQTDMAEECIRLVRARKRYIVKGTGYHTDDQCSYEKFVADALNCDCLDELRLEANGCRMHFRHVIGRSDTPYGQGTPAYKEIINEMLAADIEDYDAADVLGRAHTHYATGVWSANGKTGRLKQAYTGAGLQLRGPTQSAFTRRLRSWMYHVGMTLIEIESTGEAVVRPIIFPISMYAPKEYICLTESS